MEPSHSPSTGRGRTSARSPLFRILVAILALALVGAALTACRSQPSDGQVADGQPAAAGTPATDGAPDAATETANAAVPAASNTADPAASGEPVASAAGAATTETSDTDPAGSDAARESPDAPAPEDVSTSPDDMQDDAQDGASEATGDTSNDAPPAADAEVGEPSTDPYTEIAPLTDEPRTTFDGAEDVLQPDADYLARIVTSKGTMLVDLYESRVPNTVNNFVFLALHRFYEGVPFHRVLEDFMAQTGDPTGTGRGGPGYQFADEIDPELSHDARGIVSMANAGPGTNGSQFFITFTATPWLDGNHAVFGRVVEGLEVLDELTRVSPDEPVAVAGLDETVGSIVDQGVELSGSREQTLEARLTDALGTAPVVGQSFTLDGYRGVIGRAGESPAVGFFEQPDRIEHIDVLVRAPTPESPEQEP